MRGLVCLAALALSAAAVPASAATIVQHDDELLLKGFDPFDVSLGTLNSVTLAVSLFHPRAWFMTVPSDVPTSAQVAWSVNGMWHLPGSNATGGADVFLPLLGSGTTTVDLPFVGDGVAAGLFTVFTSGGGSMTMNMGAFLGDRILFNGRDLGFADASGSDTTFTITGSHNLIRLASVCYGEEGADPTIEDYCGSTNYTLTYNYTPHAAAVPEPGTWAMMLLGFASIGMALRRARRMTPAAA